LASSAWAAAIPVDASAAAVLVDPAALAVGLPALLALLGLLALVELLELPPELHAASSTATLATANAMTRADTRLVKREVLLIQISLPRRN
jgi:hypothetical protein